MSRIPYVGLLSKADARLLVDIGRRAHTVIEFGVGASTMLFAQTMEQGSTLISVESNPTWIESTRKLLAGVAVNVPPNFCALHHESVWKRSDVDFVFIDNGAHERLPSAVKAWPMLRVNGIMAFHDTRWTADLKNALAIIEHFIPEVSNIHCNARGSNITLVQKQSAAPFEDWNAVEGNALWKCGLAPLPPGWQDECLAVEE